MASPENVERTRSVEAVLKEAELEAIYAEQEGHSKIPRLLRDLAIRLRQREAQLATVQEERDKETELRRAVEQHNKMLCATLDTAQRQRAAAAEAHLTALRGYVQHKTDCRHDLPKWEGSTCGERMVYKGQLRCTCGLSSLLKEQP